jgi:hypothetical protein
MEPFLPDEMLEVIAEIIRREYPSLRDATFVTMVDQKRVAFNLAILSPWDRHPGYFLMTRAQGFVKDWEEKEKTRAHFVGAPDPSLVMYRLVAREHAEKVASARQLN